MLLVELRLAERDSKIAAVFLLLVRCKKGGVGVPNGDHGNWG